MEFSEVDIVTDIDSLFLDMKHTQDYCGRVFVRKAY